MIAHILQTAESSRLFDLIHVSTEDREIVDIVSALGFSPDFKRPENLSNDETPIMPVLKSVTETLATQDKIFDEIWLLMACAPLIKSEDLKKAATLFEANNGSNPVLAVTKYEVPIEWAFERSAQGKLTPVHTGMFSVPSNKIEPKYHDTGTFAVFPPDNILTSTGAGSDKNFIGYVLPHNRGIDIDTMEDWNLAEAIFNLRQMKDSRQ